MSLTSEISRRRTFAIISHPDAGKTTLTEKLLLYGGAVQLAGSVTSRKHQRATRSDWMELERQRGISVSSTVMQFEYGPYCINLLDTPGHNDFSEDTYRVLMAVDSVIMVIDAGKGIESQTRKLFQACRLKGIPIFTFMNKCDQLALEPLDLLDDLEQTLQIQPYAMNWPVGCDRDFRGVYDRRQKRLHFFEKAAGGAYRAPVSVHHLEDPQVRDQLDRDVYDKLCYELDLLDHAGDAFDVQAVRRGDMTPVFFGSALSNFGVQLLLDNFLEHAPAPGPHSSAAAGSISPEHDSFSGFIFKIQSNMDPKHRDSIAFMRVCSGRFRRDMHVVHARTGEAVRLSSSHKVLARERSTVHQAFPGDVIGLLGHSRFQIGDTLTEDPRIVYREIPRFAPECFALLHSTTTAQFKRFRAGLEDLLREGLVQVFLLSHAERRVPLLGAVGPLQFDVLQYRLAAEYRAESRIEHMPWKTVRWVVPDDVSGLATAIMSSGSRTATDERGRSVVLFESDWGVAYFGERNPKVRLSASAEAVSESLSPIDVTGSP